MITPAQDGEGFFGLQRRLKRRNAPPPRSGLVQLLVYRSLER
jgi:hypothetical protein